MSIQQNSLPTWAKKTLAGSADPQGKPQAAAATASEATGEKTVTIARENSKIRPARPCGCCDGLVFWSDPYRRIFCTFCEPPKNFAQVRAVFAAVRTGEVDEFFCEPIREWKKISVPVNVVAGLRFDEPMPADDAYTLRWRGLWWREARKVASDWSSRLMRSCDVWRDASLGAESAVIADHRIGPLEKFLV